MDTNDGDEKSKVNNLGPGVKREKRNVVLDHVSIPVRPTLVQLVESPINLVDDKRFSASWSSTHLALGGGSVQAVRTRPEKLCGMLPIT